MSYLGSATVSRQRSQNNLLLAQEIMLLELAVLDAIANNTISVTVDHTTTATVNGAAVTATPMTADDATGQSYFSVWSGATDSDLLTWQMDQVIAHFESLNFSITRLTNTTTDNTFNWKISW